MRFFSQLGVAACCCASLAFARNPAQTPAGSPAPTSQAPAIQAPAIQAPEPSHKGQILIQSHGESPARDAAQSGCGETSPSDHLPSEGAKVDVSDADRSALRVVTYDLDVRLQPANSGFNARARLTVRNDGPTPLSHLALDISSTLHWDSATLVEGTRRTPLALVQHRIDTDADHTGAAAEAVLPLPAPLAPGSSVSLDLFYSGTLAQNACRLTRLGASSSQGKAADWDGVGSAWTGLRGFGNVLWYPVASPQLFLTDGNSLFTSVGRARLQGQNATTQLRLAVQYQGEPPAAAYFCGRRAALKAAPDDPDAPIATGSGIASAEFSAQPLGFRVPSLFVVQQPELLLSGASLSGPGTQARTGPEAISSSNPSAASMAAVPATAPNNAPTTDMPVLALASTDGGTAPGLDTAASRVTPLLAEWLGPHPLSALTILDHDGQPFQDGPLLVAPAATLQTSTEAPALVYSLTHAWVQTGQPWMDEGLAQFFALLWVEREGGRPAALAQMNELLQPVALAEPDLISAADIATGQPIVSARDELFYRRKAAAIWWMLRDLAGPEPLRAALTAWRTQPESHDLPAVQAVAFEHLLERLSGKDLRWFFNDWVLRDRGLPDLSIENVAASPTPAGPGHNTGWLVAVTVRNAGATIADVPLIIRSGKFSNTSRVRVPGFAETTERVLVQTPPTEVTVNDGGTPELRASTHTRTVASQR